MGGKILFIILVVAFILILIAKNNPDSKLHYYLAKIKIFFMPVKDSTSISNSKKREEIGMFSRWLYSFAKFGFALFVVASAIAGYSIMVTFFRDSNHPVLIWLLITFVGVIISFIIWGVMGTIAEMSIATQEINELLHESGASGNHFVGSDKNISDRLNALMARQNTDDSE